MYYPTSVITDEIHHDWQQSFHINLRKSLDSKIVWRGLKAGIQRGGTMKSWSKLGAWGHSNTYWWLDFTAIIIAKWQYRRSGIDPTISFRRWPAFVRFGHCIFCLVYVMSLSGKFCFAKSWSNTCSILQEGSSTNSMQMMDESRI